MAIGQPSLYDLHRLMGSIGHTLAQIIWHADSHCIKLFSYLYIFFYIPFCMLCMQFAPNPNFISSLYSSRFSCKANAQCYRAHCKKVQLPLNLYILIYIYISLFKPFCSYTFLLYFFLAHFTFDLLNFLSRAFLAKRKQNACTPIAESTLLFSLCCIFIHILHALTSFLPRTYLTYFACTCQIFPLSFVPRTYLAKRMHNAIAPIAKKCNYHSIYIY